jgi:hypothetical protein
MIVAARAYWAPKAGNRPDEYEDAFWPANPVKRTAKRAAKRTAGRADGHADGRADSSAGKSVRFAVADGATETSFAGLWARRLVRAYGAGCFDRGDWLQQLRREQAAWYDEVLQKPLPWYAEEKVRAGAYAALVGLELAATGEWRALAVGDCCLLQWRGDELAAAFPAQAAAFFTSRPYLLSSNAAANGNLGDQVLRTSGQWLAGDRFALLSDALAQWALRAVEAGRPPWAALAKVQETGQRHFAQWVDGLRADASLRNDDVTALLITL